MKLNKLNNIKFEELILFEDSDYIIINKPPFLSTLEDRNSSINVLELARKSLKEAKVCHRLDKETSGLLVIAKHDDAYRYFSILLQNRDVTKIYHTLVVGLQEFHELEINSPLYSSSNRTRVDSKQGKPSLTLVTTLETYKKHSLLACMPFTGRMHQIRVHLASVGCPITGDKLYGGEDIYLSSIKRKYVIGKDKMERPLLSRMALHAASLSFRLPNDEIMKINAPYSKDFEVGLKLLEKNRL